MSNDNKDHLNNLRHSAAHLLAAAVMQLYPDAKRAIGPAIENGFYFDFDFGNTKISEEDFPKIEAKMREILPSWSNFERHELTKEEAEKEYRGNPYKLELIEEFTKNGEKVSFYKSGAYWDLCKGGHSPHPKNDLKHFKLLSVAGAYWRGSEKNPMLTRIYGTAFPSKTALDDYLTMMEEAKKRDHKKLGKELDLFFFTETAPGMAYWLPKGLIIYTMLYNFARSMYIKFDYHEVATPQLNKKELYETSGHWTHYRDDMFISPMSYLREDVENPLEGSEVFGVKPMNCPNAMTIFAAKTRSYNDMPMRLAETSMLHRFELSGTLNGLFRTRMFRQDDAHIFIRLSQIAEEFQDLMQMTQDMYEPFGLSYRLRFGTRPEKFMGEAADWDHAEKELRKVLQESGKEYIEVAGEGAFYGPKVDILMKDSLGREWQTGTIQLDFQQPKRFSLKYTENDGSEKTPVVFHRAIFGSIERFLGVLVEHYAGKFPVWLSPIQVTLLPIADRHIEYATKLYNALQDAGIRVELNTKADTLQAKIRMATLQKVPFMGIIGDKEVSSDNQMSVRTREGKDLGSLELSQFIQQVKQNIDKKI
jgi:threonyl-tRNA synthetase